MFTVFVFSIPVVLMFAGGVAKKLIRGPGWRHKDFFLGVEFTFASMTSALIYFLEFAKAIQNDSGYLFSLSDKLIKTGGYFFINLCIMLIIMVLHQEFEGKDDNPKRQILWLCVVANLLGMALMILFIWFIKGVK